LDTQTQRDINKAWKAYYIKISATKSLGYYEVKKHKPWLAKGCSKSLDQRKQVKLQWLQHPSEINGDNQNSIRHEASRHFKTKKQEYLTNKKKKQTNKLRGP
jgi:hypothetical protein